MGIEPTNDLRAIKRAYALQSKRCHPDDAPDEFLRLRKAYESALNYIEMNKQRKAAPSVTGEKGVRLSPQYSQLNDSVKTNAKNDVCYNESIIAEDVGDELNFDRIFAQTEKNKIQQMIDSNLFRCLSTLLADTKKRKDKALWQHYILSEDFLQAKRDPQFLSLFVDFLEKQQIVPVENLPRNMYLFLQIAFDAIFENTDNSLFEKARYQRSAPLRRLMEKHIHYAYFANDISKQIVQINDPEGAKPKNQTRELSLLYRSFQLYHDALTLYEQSRFRFGSMSRNWYELLNRLECNLHTRSRPETYQLLAFFVRTHPDLPDYFYTHAYKIYDLENGASSSRQTALKPLYEALAPRLVELKSEMQKQTPLAEKQRKFNQAYYNIYKKYSNAEAIFHFQVITLPEVDELFASELFAQLQFDDKAIYDLAIFFITRDSGIQRALWQGVYQNYIKHAERKGVDKLLQNMTIYRKNHEKRMHVLWPGSDSLIDF